LKITDRLADGWKPALWAAVSYAVIALLALSPVSGKMTTHVPVGDGAGDAFLNLWNVWWVKTAIVDLHTNPYFTKHLFWPVGTPLVYHMLSPTNAVLSIPLQSAWPGTAGLVFSLNFMLLLSFVLTGWAVFLLARSERAGTWGAWTAGLVAMLLPYRIWHANHLELLSMHWGIFYLFFFLNALERKTIGWAALAGLFAALTTYSSYEAFVYIVIATAFIVLWRVISHWGRAQAVSIAKTLGKTVPVALVLHVPLALALFSYRDWPFEPPEGGQAEFFSANLLGFLLPGSQSLLHRGWADSILPGGHGLAGDEVFLGLGLTALVVLALLRGRKSAPGVKMWAALGAVFLLLSLGPSLHAGNATVLRNMLPYAWLRKVFPFLQMSRCPVRMVGMAGVCLSLAAGIGLGPLVSDLRNRGILRTPVAGRLAHLFVALLLLLEFWPLRPIPTVEAAVPAVHQSLAKDPGRYALMPSPIGPFHLRVYMFWQTVHGKPLTVGYLSRESSRSSSFLETVMAEKDPIKRARLLAEANVRYMLFHPTDNNELLTSGPEVAGVEAGL
jgi:hypothetical protein